MSLRSLWERLAGRAGPAVPLVLYTRRNCPLCDEMKHVLAQARTARPFELVERDVDLDPELRERHGRSVPVLEVAGRVAFKGRMTIEAFERKYARLARPLVDEEEGVDEEQRGVDEEERGR
jgi:glutaredoxin